MNSIDITREIEFKKIVAHYKSINSLHQKFKWNFSEFSERYFEFITFIDKTIVIYLMYLVCIEKRTSILNLISVGENTRPHATMLRNSSVFSFHLSFDCSFQSSPLSIVYYTIISRCYRHIRIRYKQRHHRNRQTVVSSSGERERWAKACGRGVIRWLKKSSTMSFCLSTAKVELRSLDAPATRTPQKGDALCCCNTPCPLISQNWNTVRFRYQMPLRSVSITISTTAANLWSTCR